MSTAADSRNISLADETATLALGARIGHALPGPPLLVALKGSLGAGKTTLVRGLLRGLGYEGRVVSPTYTLMEPYEVDGRNFLHLDLYRIADPGELEFLGLADGLQHAVVLVEWPEHGQDWLPVPDLTVHLRPAESGRIAALQPGSAAGRAVCAAVDASPAK